MPADLPVLLGRRIVLRQPVPGDVEARLAVPHDAEEYRMYGGSGTPPPLVRAEVQADFAAYARQNLTVMRQFVVAARSWPDGRPCTGSDGQCIGIIRLHGISVADRRARLAIGIFDRRFWSQGYGTEAIMLLLDHAFSTMRLHRVDLRVLAYNLRAIRAYEKCGFVREGVERESALVDGAWHDDVIMSVLKQEYHSVHG